MVEGKERIGERVEMIERLEWLFKIFGEAKHESRGGKRGQSKQEVWPLTRHTLPYKSQRLFIDSPQRKLLPSNVAVT